MRFNVFTDSDLQGEGADSYQQREAAAIPHGYSALRLPVIAQEGEYALLGPDAVSRPLKFEETRHLSCY